MRMDWRVSHGQMRGEKIVFACKSRPMARRAFSSLTLRERLSMNLHQRIDLGGVIMGPRPPPPTVSSENFIREQSLHDLQRYRVTAGLLIRHHHCEPLFVLGPAQLPLVPQQFNILNFWRRERACGRKRLNQSQFFWPSHEERKDRLALGREAHFF